MAWLQDLSGRRHALRQEKWKKKVDGPGMGNHIPHPRSSLPARGAWRDARPPDWDAYHVIYDFLLCPIAVGPAERIDRFGNRAVRFHSMKQRVLERFGKKGGSVYLVATNE